MTKTKTGLPLQAKARTLGARTFAAISAVEGIKLSGHSRARLAEFKRNGLTPEQRRAEVIRAYSKSKPKS